jgi:putative flippase GtrA
MENTILNKLSSFIKENWLKILKFGLTGGLGTVTNLVLFFIFADKLHYPDIAVNVACFIIAGTQNYFINHLWTFRAQCAEKVSLKLWAAFMSSSVAGYAVNLGVYILLTRLLTWPYKVIPQAIGILAGMVLNFLFSNYFVFKKRNPPAE